MKYLLVYGNTSADTGSVEIVRKYLSENGCEFELVTDIDVSHKTLDETFIISVGGPYVNSITKMIFDTYYEPIDLSEFKQTRFKSVYGSRSGTKLNALGIRGCVAFWGEEAEDTLAITEYVASEKSVLDDIIRNIGHWTCENTFHGLLPYPVEIRRGEGRFDFSGDTIIAVSSEENRPIAEYLKNQLTSFCSLNPSEIIFSQAPECNCIHLLLIDKDQITHPEGYQLSITSEKISISSASAAGLFYGVQTLIQILFYALVSSQSRDQHLAVQTVEISDFPRFEWRGVMLDVARHFFTVDEVKKLIDYAALYKMNRLHLHLTDDQGWRIHINSWPRLTEVGGASQVGGGKGGYYTQEDYKEIVEYAAARFLTVVPEIDMPGHTYAALASYAELNPDGIAREYYSGVKVDFSSLDIKNENTYKFVRDVIKEISELTPGQYIHIGGDEAGKTKQDDYLSFIQSVDNIVASVGKILMGWEETAKCELNEKSIIQFWNEPKFSKAAVQKGYRVIFSPANKIYLDMKYDENTRLGTSWAGYSSVRKAYDWDPATEIAGINENSILGVESPLWTETVTNLSEMEFMLFPRLLGVSEIGWSAKKDRIWELYKYRLALQGIILRKLNVNFYRSDEIDWDR